MILDWGLDLPPPAGSLRDADGKAVLDVRECDTETGRCVVLDRDADGRLVYDPVTDGVALATVYRTPPLTFVPFDEPRKDGMLADLFDLVCENLPEDWTVCVDMRRGEADIILLNPDGYPVDLCDDDLTTDEMVLSRVNHARTCDGLCEVEVAE